MQENEFEKQLKDMMDEFKLVPPVSVWEKVSRRLNEGRRKKRPFIFLLFLGLLVAGYFMYQYARQQPVHYTNNKTNEELKKDSLSLKNPGQLPAEKTTGQNSSTVPANKNSYTAPKTSPPKTNRPATFDIKESKYKTPGIPTNAVSSNNNNNSSGQLKINQETTTNDVPVVMEQQLQNNEPVAANDSTKLIDNAARNDSLNKNIAQTDSIQIKQGKKESAKKGIVKNPSDKNYTIPKWQWGVNAFYGWSNAIENLVDFNKAAPANLSYSPGIVTGSVDSTHHNSNPYSASNAYQFGFVVQKKIMKNGFISSGLNFIHLSTKSDVTGKKDSAYTVQNGNIITNSFYVSSFYQPGPSKAYTNTYNFIELPVYFQQDVFYRHKLSLSYNAGFSIRQLISSDALIYNRYSNIYYSKDELLRKTQWQVMAGINLKINTGKNMAVYVGPQFSYSLSNLLNDKDVGNFHLINYGVQAGLMFHKK